MNEYLSTTSNISQQLLVLSVEQDTLYRESSLSPTVPHTADDGLSSKVNIQLLKKIPAFMDPEASSLCTQKPNKTCHTSGG